MILTSNFPNLFDADAVTIFPFIFMVNPEDKALVAHEMVHYAEQRRWLTIPWWIAYLVSKKFRLNAEVRAYKVQIAMGGLTPEGAAYHLSTLYRLGITQAQAVTLLS